MKLVREHINEKFTEDSDPIRDMGIGIKEIISKDYKELGKQSPNAVSIKFFGKSDYDDEAVVVWRTLKYIVENNNYTSSGFQRAFDKAYKNSFIYREHINKEKVKEALYNFYGIKVKINKL